MKPKKVAVATPPEEEDVSTEEENTSYEEEASEDEEESIPVPAYFQASKKEFGVANLLHILNEPPKDVNLPFRAALQNTEWSAYASGYGLSVDDLIAGLERLHRQVMKSLSLRDIITIALSNQAKYITQKKVRLVNSYQCFLKEFHGANGHMKPAERMKVAASKFKEFSEAEKQKYKDKATTLNIASGILNADGTPKAKRTAKQQAIHNGPDLRMLFSPLVSSSSLKVPAKETLVTKSPRKTKEPVPEVKIEAFDEDEDEEKVFVETKPPGKAAVAGSKSKGPADEQVKVSVFDYFVEGRRGQGLKESKEAIQAAFDKMSDAERVQYTYKIMQLVAGKYGKRTVLSKADQEHLDKFEKRPVRPGTAYTVFMNEKNADPTLAHLPYREKSSEIGALWKAQNAETRAIYEAIFAEKKALYEEEHKEFLKNLPPFRREQETVPRLKKPRKRRASVGEASSPTEENQTNSTFLQKTKPPTGAAAKRRQRSKTIDSSSMNIRDFFESSKVQDTPTPVKKSAKRKATEEVDTGMNGGEVTANGTSDRDESQVASPKKKKNQKKQKVVLAEKENGTVLDPPHIPMVVLPLELASPTKTKKEAKAPVKSAPQPEPSAAAADEPVKKSPKKRKKLEKMEEPQKPPDTAKEYFKSVFKGIPSQAKKEFKKLSLTEKQHYHEELKAVSNKYLEDLSTYMRTLSKAEMAEFLARQGQQ